MNPLLKLACLADISNILKIVDIALIVLLVVVFGVLVLIFFRGLLRGWKYGTYRLIAFAIMVTVVLATLTPQANALGGVNLTGFNLPNLNFTLTIDGTEHAISVAWTTIQATLEDLIIQIAEAFGANGSYSGIISYASVLATSIIKLILIFAWGLILSTLGLLLIMLLWHIIFKRFTPRDRRKIKKLRIVSAVEEVLIGAACLGMLISPFTSIANALNSNFKVDEKEAKQNETVSMITDILGVYNQSAFAKTFFSWNSMDGSTTFDQQLISFLTQSEVKDVKTDLVSEISSIASISSKAINAGLLSAKGSEGIRWYFLLSSSAIPGLIMELSSSTLIQSALPFAVSLAINLDAVKEVLGENTCNYLSSADTNWTEVMQSMSRIYQDILDAGVIDCVVDVENGTATPTFDWTQLKYVFSGKDANGNERDAKGAMHKLTSEFKDSQLFSHLMAGLLSELGKKELDKEEPADLSILDFLPVKETESGKEIDYEELVKTDYTKEFNLLYDSIYAINEVSPSVVDKALDLVQNPPTDEDQETKYRELIAESALHAKEYVEVVVGERESDGTPKKGSKSCLLDSYFVDNALPSLVTFMEKAGGAALDMDLSFSETKTKLVTVDDYKKEFGAALDVLAEFGSSEEGNAFLKDGTGMVYDPDGNLISIDPKLVAALQTSLDKTDDSLLMQEALPQVAEHYFDEFKDTLSEYGIEQLDFHCENFGHELSDLLDLITYAGDLLLAINQIGDASSYLTTSLILNEEGTLLRVLDIFASSKILNPELEGKNNVNFASLLNHIFSSAGLEDFQIDADMLSSVTLATERNEDGSVKAYHENHAILAVMMGLAKSVPLTELLGLGNASSAQIVKTLSKVDVKDLFAKIGESEVMKSVAGNALDKYMGSVLDYDSSSGISFKNVENWALEGEIIAKIIDLATNGIDISNFDMENISPTLMKDLFTSLASSAIFEKKDEDGSIKYMFPEFFSSKVLGMLKDDTSIGYFADEGKTISGDATLEQKKENCGLFVSNCADLNTKEDWTKDGGEIESFSKVLSGVQSLGGFSSLSSFSRDKLPSIRAMLESLASSSAFGQVLLGNALSKSFSSLGSSSTSSSLDLSLADPYVFFDDEYKGVAGKAERESEVSALCDVMDILFDQNYGLLKSDGSFDEDKLSISSLSVDNCLKPLLGGIASSKVLNPSKDPGEETLLRSIFKMVLVKSNLYGTNLGEDDPISAHSDKTISSIVGSLIDAQIQSEIDNLCDVLKLIQNSSLFDGNSLKLSSLDSSACDELKNLLTKINGSELLYRSLAIQIDKAVSEVSLPAPFDADLKRCNPYVKDDAAASDYDKYSAEEIECVAKLLTSVSQFSSLDFTDVSSLAKVDLSELLSPMYASRIFNEQVSSDGLTSAQAFTVDLLSEMGLGKMIYSSSSPKDTALSANYTDEAGKYKYLVSSTLKIGEEGNYSQYSLTKQQESGNGFYETLGSGEGSLSSLLRNLNKHGLSKLLEGGSIDFSSLSSATLSSLLKDLSRCALLSDVPINALANYLAGSDSSVLEVDGLDLSLANFYYPYYYDAETGAKRASVSWNASYDEDEIDLLVDLLDLIKANKKSLEAKKVGELDSYALRQMLLELNDSLLFHVTGPNTHSSTYGLGWSEDVSGKMVYDPNATGAQVYRDLTVFEQMMYLVYDTSGLATRSFNAYHDFSYFIEANCDESLASELKLHAKIQGLSESKWREEVSAMTTNDDGDEGLIQVAKTSGLMDDDSSSVAMTTDLLKKLTPGKVMKLLRSLGRSSVCGDALATTISSFLTSGEEGEKGLGVETFSTHITEVGTSAAFSSDHAFLEEGVAYEDLYFYNSSYTGNETFTLKLDLDGDKTCETSVFENALSTDASVLKYVVPVYDDASKIWNIGVSKIGCDYEFTISEAGQLSYMFDTADYYLPYGALEEGQADSTSLELLLCSLRKSDGSYFSFEGKASALEEANNEQIPLYGIASIVMDSSFYSSSYFNSSFVPVAKLDLVNGDFSGGAVSLYQMFSITASLGTQSVPVKILDTIDLPHLEAEHPSGIELVHRLNSIEKLMETSTDCFAEGAFFEKALLGAALSEGAHTAIATSFSSSSGEAAKTASYRYAMSLLNSESYKSFLSSDDLPYNYTITDGEGKDLSPEKKASSTSVFAKQLIAGALNERVNDRLLYANLPSHTLGSFSLESPTVTRDRIAFLSSDDRTVLKGFDAYGYNSSNGSYGFDSLASLAETETKAINFMGLVSSGITMSASGAAGSSDYQDYLLSADQKSELAGICNAFDLLSGVSKSYANLAYTADVYDFFVLKGKLVNSTAAPMNFFFHAALTGYGATDFPSTCENGVLNGVDTAFKYVNVAQTSMSL